MGCCSCRKKGEIIFVPKKQIVADGISAAMFVISNEGNIKQYYDVEKAKIGEGSFARVCRCTNKSTGAVKAVKITRKSRSNKVKNEKLRYEVAIMKMLDHPNCMRLIEHFEDNQYLYFIMDLCCGDELFERMVESGHFTEIQSAIIMQQVFRGVLYMHSCFITHRDLKPENFMFLSDDPVERSVVKIIDFGLSRLFEEGQTLVTKCGAPYYVSPQVLAGRYDEMNDVWACGILLYILICGYPPFYGETDAEVLGRVRLGNFTFNQADWKHIGEECKELVRGLLKMNPCDRLTARQALHHGWVTEKTPQLRVSLKMRFLDNLRRFRTFNFFKKAVLHILANLIDEEQIRPLRDTFMALDWSGEGTISAVELREGLVRAGVQEHEMPTDLEDIMKDIDMDGSGEIDYSEFLAASMDPRIYLREELCWAAFRVFDRQGDGSIGVQELCDVLNGGGEGNVSRELVAACVKEIDENQDGLLDFDEFMHMMKGITKIQEKKLKKGEKGKKGEVLTGTVAGAAGATTAAPFGEVMAVDGATDHQALEVDGDPDMETNALLAHEQAVEDVEAGTGLGRGASGRLV